MHHGIWRDWFLVSRVEDLRTLPTVNYVSLDLFNERGFGRMSNLNCELSMHSESRMLESFDDRHVRVFKISVLPHKRNGDGIEQSLLTVETRMK